MRHTADPLGIAGAAKPDEELAPDGEVPVAEGVADRAGTGGPRAAAQHSVALIKEDLRVLRVREALEARVGGELAGGPLPDVPDHAQRTVGTRPRRERADLSRLEGELIQVRPLRRGRRLSPRIKPLGPLFRIPRGCLLPLGLRREALARPPGVRVGL